MSTLSFSSPSSSALESPHALCRSVFSWLALMSLFIAFNWSIINCSAQSMLAASDTRCFVITVHAAGSLKLDLVGANTTAMTNTITISYPCYFVGKH
jgi:hypothetical protein